MDIQWHGLSCFTLNGKSASVVIDPFDEKEVGLKPIKFTADICLANADFKRHHNIAALNKEVKIFDWPGEFEAKGIVVQGIPAYDRPREKEENKSSAANNVILFTIEIDGFKLCHLSNLGHKLTPEMLEIIGEIDILFIPIGASECLDVKKAHEVIEQIDPRIVIPMYYKLPGIKLPLAELDTFLKEVGLHAPAKEKVLQFQSRAQLPQEQTEFRILEAV